MWVLRNRNGSKIENGQKAKIFGSCHNVMNIALSKSSISLLSHEKYGLPKSHHSLSYEAVMNEIGRKSSIT